MIHIQTETHLRPQRSKRHTLHIPTCMNIYTSIDIPTHPNINKHIHFDIFTCTHTLTQTNTHTNRDAPPRSPHTAALKAPNLYIQTCMNHTYRYTHTYHNPNSDAPPRSPHTAALKAPNLYIPTCIHTLTQTHTHTNRDAPHPPFQIAAIKAPNHLNRNKSPPTT
jgi:hypothetical protein